MATMHYPPISPENGAQFTRILHSDTYPFIGAGRSNHEGHTVFITGGNRGIGKSIALSFAAAGAPVIALGAPDGFPPDIAAEIQSAAQSTGRFSKLPQVLTLNLDVTDPQSVAAAAEAFKMAVPNSPLDILVNNAGFMTPALPVMQSDLDPWWFTFQVNLKGVFLMVREFSPLLLDTTSTSTAGGLKTIVNINSVAAHNLRVNASAYGTSKLAVLKFTEFLLVELAEKGLLAYSVHPGGVMTQLAEAMPREAQNVLRDKPVLVGDTIAYLTQERREWLAGRYLSCTWDMDELFTRRDEILEQDKLKVRLCI